MNFEAFRQWSNRSLANLFALRAAFIAVASSLVVALISLIVIFSVEQATLQTSLQEKAGRLAERIEGAIKVTESAVTDLSRNPMFTTALLDSPGRNTYVVPFLENFRFPIAASSGLALCDINGERLAGMRSPLSDCRMSSELFKQVIATGKTQRELVQLKNGHLSWATYQGVLFPYTGTVEGVVVSQLDLHEVLHDVPRDLELDGVALVRTGDLANLLSIDADGTAGGAPTMARRLLFKDAPDAVPFPIEAVAQKHLLPFQGKLTPLVLGYGLGSLLLVLLVTYWARRASRQLIAPLAALTNTAQVITESGDLSVAVPSFETGEVGQLTSALSVMVKTLQTSEAILERKVAQRTEALQKSQAVAEAANVAKSRFLANMSHEIRTPLNGIMGMAQMLLKPNLADGERHDYARIVLNSGHTLLTLLNDILDLSKVEAGKIELESIVFDASQVVHETESLFAQSASRKELSITSDWKGPADQRYRGDPHRLRQMLSNLVGNAVKFTAQGSIHIEAREIERDGQTASLEFSVTDTGVGIPSDQQGLLFQPFTQADSSTTREFGGTGLGLSIVRALASQMGGEAGVYSEEGKGSRFWLRIRADLVTADQDSRQFERSSEQEPDSMRVLSSFSGHILAVEDDATNRKVIQALLGTLGLTVAFVEDGAQAVEAITRGDAADLILMDLQMPVMDGYQATEEIRRWETKNGQKRRPIIALTADAFEEDRQHCLKVGMDDVMTKPIAMDVLRSTLRRWLPAGAENIDSSTLVAPISKPMDLPRILALLRELEPMLANNQFGAVGHFKELQRVVSDTDAAKDIAGMEWQVEELRFDQALDSLRQIAAAHGWEGLGHD
jgi:signal transduction histidine kinase/DNA-binding response OmpR family regulator